MIRATDTRQLHMQYKLHVKCRTGLSLKTVKLVRAAASYHATKPRSTRERVATINIKRHTTPCVLSVQSNYANHGSDTTVGICATENQNFLSHAEATPKDLI